MAGMTPEDVFELKGVADPRLSPDGRTAAFAVWSVDGESNEYRGAIWLAPVDGSAPATRFTSGTKRDATPRWSPDGKRLAFTSKRDGEHMDLYVIPVSGGEPGRLTTSKEDVAEPAWSPDGSHIAYVSRVPDAKYDQKDDKRREPRRFTRLRSGRRCRAWERRRRLLVATTAPAGRSSKRAWRCDTNTSPTGPRVRAQQGR